MPTAEELTSTTAVLRYLHSLNSPQPFPAVRDIRRICLGSTNFTYRLFLAAPYPSTSTTANTAILKYASSYTAGEPRVQFSPERQSFEVRAMAGVPWREVLGTGPPQPQPHSQAQAQAQHPKIIIPEIYFEDRVRHVIIMEDGTPRGEGLPPAWEERSHSSRIFLEEVAPSEQKYETAKVLGKTLGMFLARMHNWGRAGRAGGGATDWVRESFAGNTPAKDLTIQEAIVEFWDSVRCTETAISEIRKREVQRSLEMMRRGILDDLETLVMGDFWLGNVLLVFDASDVLQRLSIIDWEFAMVAPAFVDAGNFIGEVFLIHYFESNDEVYIILLEAFIREYEAVAERINANMVLSYAGAHIVQALPRRVNSPRSRASKGNAAPCLEHALDFITARASAVESSAMGHSLQELLQIMRGHRPIRDLRGYSGGVDSEGRG